MSEKQYRTLMLPPTGKKRDDYFDIVRGIAVFLMLWGHSIQYSSCGTFRFLYKGIIIKHNKTEPTYTKTSLFLCEKRRFFMARTEKGVVTTI